MGPSFQARTLKRSLPKVKKNWLLCHRVGPLPPGALLPLETPPQLRRRKKPNPPRANPETTTWDSDFSTNSSPEIGHDSYRDRTKNIFLYTRSSHKFEQK